jgi:hypothetical protein
VPVQFGGYADGWGWGVQRRGGAVGGLRRAGAGEVARAAGAIGGGGEDAGGEGFGVVFAATSVDECVSDLCAAEEGLGRWHTLGSSRGWSCSVS